MSCLCVELKLFNYGMCGKQQVQPETNGNDDHSLTGPGPVGTSSEGGHCTDGECVAQAESLAREEEVREEEVRMMEEEDNEVVVIERVSGYVHSILV